MSQDDLLLSPTSDSDRVLSPSVQNDGAVGDVREGVSGKQALVIEVAIVDQKVTSVLDAGSDFPPLMEGFIKGEVDVKKDFYFAVADTNLAINVDWSTDSLNPFVHSGEMLQAAMTVTDHLLAPGERIASVEMKFSIPVSKNVRLFVCRVPCSMEFEDKPNFSGSFRTNIGGEIKFVAFENGEEIGYRISSLEPFKAIIKDFNNWASIKDYYDGFLKMFNTGSFDPSSIVTFQDNLNLVLDTVLHAVHKLESARMLPLRMVRAALLRSFKIDKIPDIRALSEGGRLNLSFNRRELSQGRRGIQFLPVRFEFFANGQTESAGGGEVVVAYA